MEIEVREEMRINSTIGQVKAVDEDLGENSDIEYAIIDGNDNKIFEVNIIVKNKVLMQFQNFVVFLFGGGQSHSILVFW